jgi:hypothetical protein
LRGTMIDIANLMAVSIPPVDPKEWLPDAEAGVDYLLSQLRNDETILYALLQCTLVHGVLADRAKVTPPDHADLLHAMLMPDSTWSISHVSGGGEPDRVYLAPPHDHTGSEALDGAESLVARRSFTSVDKGKTRTEVSQRLVHALDLYWLDEESAFCRLDEHGDIEPVLRVIDLEPYTGQSSDILVTIKARDLARYMVVTNTVLVQKFDFTRFIPGSFTMWAQHGEYRERGADLFYNTTSQAGASYANGILISRPALTYAELVHEHQRRWNDDDKQYATFKAYDWKHKRTAEISCGPTALASYFEPKSPLPFQITPAFFRPEVLQRYKADPEKYTLEHRSVRSRAGWSLKTYDINEAGQVHTYLHYLGDLPYQEQLYWQAFNEWPKASISKRAYQTDIQGQWTDIPDPLVELVAEVRKLDETKPDWWQPRGEDLRATAHYPITTSPDEWGNSILILDQMLVEGFASKGIRARLDNLSHLYEKEWGSLKLIQDLMIAQGFAASDATDAMEPLRQLHFLRSKVKGHAAEAQRQQLIKEARTKNGSLKEHFKQLAFDCQEAFEKACSSLSRA